ncbi:hypothetical protein DFH05DRAFT_888038 [Lentinula detonsa]|uniref:Uncharacterized protein n=1 Tax=Lentinula detonsa TaxID=2804962 RepID=A0A9W8U0S3_9AGAR|nr:hypothetical protein DFH05DRAFT_888038 [Lentinula detonsa]
MIYSRSIVAVIIAASAISALAAPVPDGRGGKQSEGNTSPTAAQKANSSGSGDMQKNEGPKHRHGHGHRHGHKHNATMSVVPPDTKGINNPPVGSGNPGLSSPLSGSSTTPPDNTSSMNSASSNGTDSSSSDSALTDTKSTSPASKAVHAPLTAGSRRELSSEEGQQSGVDEDRETGQKKIHHGKGPRKERGSRKEKQSNTGSSQQEEGEGGDNVSMTPDSQHHSVPGQKQRHEQGKLDSEPEGSPMHDGHDREVEGAPEADEEGGKKKGGPGGRKQRKLNKGGKNKQGGPRSERSSGKHESKEQGERKHGERHQRQPQILDRRYPQTYGSDLD